MANHVIDLILSCFTPDSGREIDVVKGARGTAEVACRGFTAWIRNQKDSCLLGYWHHLRIWSRGGGVRLKWWVGGLLRR